MNKRKLERQLIKKKDKLWSIAVKERDKECVICGETKRLNAHHIIPREIEGFRWILQNGISLCPSHHKYNIQISAHRNSLAFFVFMEKNHSEQLNYLKDLIGLIL